MSRYPWKEPGFDAAALVAAAKKMREVTSEKPAQPKKPIWLMPGFDAKKTAATVRKTVAAHKERCRSARHLVWQ